MDEGDCYYVIYADLNNCIICQKDLLKEGTLEEFEEIFKDKLVLRKDSLSSQKEFPKETPFARVTGTFN